MKETLLKNGATADLGKMMIVKVLIEAFQKLDRHNPKHLSHLQGLYDMTHDPSQMPHERVLEGLNRFAILDENREIKAGYRDIIHCSLVKEDGKIVIQDPKAVESERFAVSVPSYVSGR